MNIVYIPGRTPIEAPALTPAECCYINAQASLLSPTRFRVGSPTGRDEKLALFIVACRTQFAESIRSFSLGEDTPGHAVAASPTWEVAIPERLPGRADPMDMEVDDETTVRATRATFLAAVRQPLPAVQAIDRMMQGNGNIGVAEAARRVSAALPRCNCSSSAEPVEEEYFML
jgi:hypothetical protein